MPISRVKTGKRVERRQPNRADVFAPRTYRVNVSTKLRMLNKWSQAVTLDANDILQWLAIMAIVAWIVGWSKR